jgi:hypothetical protein
MTCKIPAADLPTDFVNNTVPIEAQSMQQAA